MDGIRSSRLGPRCLLRRDPLTRRRTRSLRRLHCDSAAVSRPNSSPSLRYATLHLCLSSDHATSPSSDRRTPLWLVGSTILAHLPGCGSHSNVGRNARDRRERISLFRLPRARGPFLSRSACRWNRLEREHSPHPLCSDSSGCGRRLETRQLALVLSGHLCRLMRQATVPHSPGNPPSLRPKTMATPRHHSLLSPSSLSLTPITLPCPLPASS